jgi:hypothetical protein
MLSMVLRIGPALIDRMHALARVVASVFNYSSVGTIAGVLTKLTIAD